MYDGVQLSRQDILGLTPVDSPAIMSIWKCQSSILLVSN